MGYQQLTQGDVDHFLKHGWIKLSDCFTQQQVDDLAGNLWTRLGMDPNDKSTWHSEPLNLPSHSNFDASSFAPKAWAAICDLVGGEERIADYNRTWNMARISMAVICLDGTLMVHYLDSPEQGLLVIPLFSDIQKDGGGTMICPGAIPKIADHLHKHPEGVSPWMISRADNPNFDRPVNLEFFCDVAKSMPDDAFVEVTGKVGDVYLLHPLMLHSASNNKLRNLRVITNPPVSLKEPFFNDRSNFSVVERKTLAALGRDDLGDWKIAGNRDRLVPERLKRQQKMKEEELKRLEELKAKVNNAMDANLGQQTTVA